MLRDLTIAIVSAVLGALFGSIAATKEGRKAAALSLMQRVEDLLSRFRSMPVAAAQQEVIAYYTTKGATLSPGAAAYLDYLGALEFLLYSIDKKLVDRKYVDSWLRGLVMPDRRTRQFIIDLQGITGDGAGLEHLCRRLNETKPSAKGGTANG